MRWIHALGLIAVLLITAPTVGAETIFPGSINRPNTKGDQVIFFYDVRDGFTTFLGLRNEAASEIHVQVLFYDANFDAPFTQTVTIPFAAGKSGAPGTGGIAVIDVGALRASGLPAGAGVAFATVVDDSGHPIVTRGLSGNFTIANSATGSAWGSPGAARNAIHPSSGTTTCVTDKPPNVPLGTVIDGSDPLFTPIQPANADLATYYNPDTLAPAAIGGNELIFISFVDVPGTTYTATATATAWTAAALKSTGEQLPAASIDVNGVLVSDLASVIGPGVSGSSGAVTFTAPPRSAPLTRLIFFSESLGTFGTGYLLPRK
jgi:hypothetical protein